MARLAIVFFALLASGVYAADIKPDDDTDFPSLGDTSDGLNRVVLPPPPPKTEKISEIPTPLTPYVESVKASGFAQSSPPTPKEGEFTPIPSLNLPEFEKVQSLNLPKIDEVPTLNLPAFRKIPDIKFAAQGEGGVDSGGGSAIARFEEPQNIGKLEFGPAPAAQTATSGGPKLPFVREEAGGGSRAPAGSSTPTASPLAFPSFGTSSTPVSVPPNPVRLQPFTFGQSSTPIANPLTPNIITPVRQTPFVFGESSSPRSQAVPQNIVTPFIFGQSSTPIGGAPPSFHFGPSSTPTAHSFGPSSTPQGLSSTPQGVSSTPHGTSSTPSIGLSSTPRGR